MQASSSNPFSVDSGRYVSSQRNLAALPADPMNGSRHKRPAPSAYDRETTRDFHPFPLPTDREPQDGSPTKKNRFKVLSSLERKGLEAEKADLEKKLLTTDDPNVQLRLKRAQLTELRSCLQYTKDKYRELQNELARAQDSQRSMREELHHMTRERDEALRSKKRGEENIRKLEVRESEKRARLATAEKRLQGLEEQHEVNLMQLEEKDKKMRVLADDCQQTVEGLQSSLRDAQMKLAEAEQKHNDCLTKYAQTKIQLYDLQITHQQLVDQKKSLEELYLGEQCKNEAQNKTIIECSIVIDNLKKQIEQQNSELSQHQLTIDEQNACIRDIASSIQKLSGSHSNDVKLH